MCQVELFLYSVFILWENAILLPDHGKICSAAIRTIRWKSNIFKEIFTWIGIVLLQWEVGLSIRTAIVFHDKEWHSITHLLTWFDVVDCVFLAILLIVDIAHSSFISLLSLLAKDRETERQLLQRGSDRDMNTFTSNLQCFQRWGKSNWGSIFFCTKIPI